MVTTSRTYRKIDRGAVLLELVVALSILGVASIPLAYSFAKEKALCRAYYFRAVALEIVDGEMELLAAGEWKSFPEGEQPYTTRAESAANLPPGRFEFTRLDRNLRLEWIPTQTGVGGRVTRETRLP